jgi:hypothetical protein
MAELKDSGTRQEWATGAVRDNQEGKGRCDLLPLTEVAALLDDDFLNELALWDEDYGIVKLYDALMILVDRFFPNPYTAILELAVHFEDGARKYGDNNWRKGIPASRYLDSAIRHYLKHMRGDTDEPHHRACAWNILCMIWELSNHDQAIYEVKENEA